ncbi:MAG: desulfoferrodoxin [Candidatus Cloacimonetes bacterium]|jgi:superoxide reductase|nr:desulfoferrodoxin [Candidatus Cloacimonadota bacterium]
MVELRQLYYCKKCKNLVEITQAGQPALVCCGEPMNLLSANSVDAANEKHVPVVEDKGDFVNVTVGSVEHPMTEEHHIVFIEVLTKDAVYRKELTPGMKPFASFPVKYADIVEVREFCNLHMLWKK